MNDKNFNKVFLVDQSPAEVFKLISDVPGWWSEDFKGESKKPGDEFEVQFGDIHYSRQKIVEVIPNKKIVWLVTDSRLNFLKNKSEWNDTSIHFEISERDRKTEIRFTHVGLLPGIECFEKCSGGWNHFLENSLLPMITTGKPKPHQKTGTIIKNK